MFLREALLVLTLAGCVHAPLPPATPEAPHPPRANPFVTTPGPQAVSPKRVAVFIETSATAEPGALPAGADARHEFARTIGDALVHEGYEAFDLGSVTPLPNASAPDSLLAAAANCGAAYVLHGTADVRSHLPGAFLEGVAVFPVTGTYSLALAATGAGRVLATSAAKLQVRPNVPPVHSFDHTTIELMQRASAEVLRTLRPALE